LRKITDGLSARSLSLLVGSTSRRFRNTKSLPRQSGATASRSFQLGDAGEQPLDLGQQLCVLLHQRRQERRRAVVVRRIGRRLCHAELESARPHPLNTSCLSHTVAAGE
jgi:hypothetical protein